MAAQGQRTKNRVGLSRKKLAIAIAIVVGLFVVGELLAQLGNLASEDSARIAMLTYRGVGMQPTLEDGQAIVVRNLHAGSKLERFDLVVYRPPSDTSRTFVGRIIGLPGESVEVSSGQVVINEEPLDDVVVVEHAYALPPFPVPIDSYFILGDNRNDSVDSHVFGPVPVAHILGVAEPTSATPGTTTAN